MGTFDPSTFLDMTFDAPNSTVRENVDEGEYNAAVSKVDLRPWKAKDGTSEGVALDLLWSIEDESVKAKLGQDKVLVKQGIMLDLNAGNGIDTGKGKNVSLGKLREALGLNKPGFSFRQLEGQMAKVLIKHRIVDGEIFADVKGVRPL